MRNDRLMTVGVLVWLLYLRGYRGEELGRAVVEVLVEVLVELDD